jgi:hypothetical protein
MNGSWKEAETRIVNLPDDSTHIFGLYLNFVYTGKFNTMRKSEQELHRLDETTFKNHIEHEYQDLFRIYVLAEKLQDISAKDAAITAAIEVSQVAMRDGSWIPPSFVTANNIYEGTPEGSLGRRLVMDMCGTVPLSYVVDQIHKYKFTSDFVSDLGKVLERTREMNFHLFLHVQIQNFLVLKTLPLQVDFLPLFPSPTQPRVRERSRTKRPWRLLPKRCALYEAAR